MFSVMHILCSKWDDVAQRTYALNIELSRALVEMTVFAQMENSINIWGF